MCIKQSGPVRSEIYTFSLVGPKIIHYTTDEAIGEEKFDKFISYFTAFIYIETCDFLVTKTAA